MKIKPTVAALAIIVAGSVAVSVANAELRVDKEAKVVPFYDFRE